MREIRFPGRQSLATEGGVSSTSQGESEHLANAAQKFYLSNLYPLIFFQMNADFFLIEDYYAATFIPNNQKTGAI